MSQNEPSPIFVGTNQAFFFLVDEWRPGARPHFTHQTLTREKDPIFLKYMAEFGVHLPLSADPFCDVSSRHADALQTWTFTDVLPDRSAERRYGPFMDLRHAGRVSDGVMSLCRERAGATDRAVGVGMHQFGDAGRVSARRRALVRFATIEIGNIVERGHVTLPSITGSNPLPARLQQVFDRLLAGLAPKSIARELGLSVWTVRDHVQRLYRFLDVSGRDELMARFVGRARE